MMGRNTQHAAHAGENAVDDEAVDHRIDAVGRQRPVCQGGQGVDPHGQPVGQPLANDVEGQVEGQQHHCQRRWGWPVYRPVRIRSNFMLRGVLPALMALHHGGAHHSFQ